MPLPPWKKSKNLNNFFNCLQILLPPIFLSSDNKKSWDDSGVPFFPILSLFFQLPLVCFLHSLWPYYLTESSQLIQVSLLPVQINPQQNTWLSFYFLITLNTKNFLPFLHVVLGFVSCLNHHWIIFPHSSAAHWELLSIRPQNLWLEAPKGLLTQMSAPWARNWERFGGWCNSFLPPHPLCLVFFLFPFSLTTSPSLNFSMQLAWASLPFLLLPDNEAS